MPHQILAKCTVMGFKTGLFLPKHPIYDGIVASTSVLMVQIKHYNGAL
ncbi:MAG: hypothetical protein WA981_01990 [Glaciecola sp.]